MLTKEPSVASAYRRTKKLVQIQPSHSNTKLKFLFSSLPDPTSNSWNYRNSKRSKLTSTNQTINFLFSVWAETGEFRDNHHSSLSAVANMDSTHLNFQNASVRNRRDRKPDSKYFIIR